jgi:hypothetical protein
MRIRLTLKPGQEGTKQLTEKYGASLVCIRYRYDKKRGKRWKTVELIGSSGDTILNSHTGMRELSMVSP